MARSGTRCSAWLIAVTIIGGAVIGPTVAHGAVCGDGIWDRDWEFCDDGAANGIDGCCTESCEIVDRDGDGICDAADPCTSPAPPLADVAFVIRGLATAEPDDSFALTATMAPAVPIDPAADGLSVVLQEELVGPIVRAVIPGGAGWRTRPGGAWSFRDRRGAAAGITRIEIKPTGDGRYTVTIEGRRRSYPTTGRPQLFTVSIGLAAPLDGTVGRCGDGYLSWSRCAYTGSGNTLRCVLPPSPRPCASSDADALVRCDIRNAVAAQEAYYATHHTYLSGDCSVLPSFVASPGVVCNTIDATFVFSVVVTSPQATLVCIYDSAPPAGRPSLVCS